MTFSLQKISNNIPPPSARVQTLFSQAVTPDVVEYGLFSRYVYGSLAVGLSLINTLGYGLAIPSRIVTALIYRDFENLTKDCQKDATHVFQSLYFAAAMSTYLFLSIIPWLGFELKLIKPYELRDEATALALKASKPIDFELPECEIQGTDFKLYADWSQLVIDPIVDINHLLGVLDSRRDLVLIQTPDNKAYLVQRDNATIRQGIMHETLKLYHLEAVSVPIKPVTIKPPSSLVESVLNLSQTTSPKPGLKDNDTAHEVAPEKEIDLVNPLQEKQRPSVNPLEPQPHIPKPSQSPAASDDLENSFEEIHIEPGSSPLQKMPTIASRAKRAVNTLWTSITGVYHLSKDMKYRHILAHYSRIVNNNEGSALYKKVYQTEDSKLRTQCLEIYTIITNPNFSTIQEHHKAFITALREAKKLLDQTPNEACKAWIHFFAMSRFADIKLYGYCKSLVESVSNPFNTPLTLKNFWGQLQERNEKISKIPTEQGTSWYAGAYHNLKGHLNVKDFLLETNIPYIYGQIRRGEKVTTILRHGAPIAQREYLEVFYRAIWGEQGNTTPPEVTSDYLAFIEAACEKKQLILHVVLENADWKVHGDESGRVRARIALGRRYSNFYPVALRLDGAYFNPNEKSYEPRNLIDVKIEFYKQLFSDDKGFHIPGNLKQGAMNPERFRQCLENVHQMFFVDKTTLDSVGEFQAFHLLTYAEMILSLCDSLNISYLEVPCKDDIDRGGVMKAILILLHLYHTGKFDPKIEKDLNEMLEALMVNIIAAPLIVKKKPILKSRGILLFHVLQVLERAVAKTPVPSISYSGNFNVVSEPQQGLIPMGNTSHTKEEYQSFVENLKKELLFTFNENTIQDCHERNGGKERVTGQIERDLGGQYMRYNDNLLNPGRKKPEKIPAYLIAELQKAGVSEEEGWKILSAYTQTIGTDMLLKLQPLFRNDKLKYDLMADYEKIDNDLSSGLYLSAKEGQTSIKLVTYFKVINIETPGTTAQIRATFEIPDHRIQEQLMTVKVI